MALNSQSSQAISPKGKVASGSDANNWQNDGTAEKKAAAMQEIILDQLESDKAENIIQIDLSGKSDVADAMVIASGRSQRHVGALAEKLARELKDRGFGTVSVEGKPACDWVLIDAGDVIVHLFRPEVREFYNLERIWSTETMSDPARKISH